MKVVAIAAAAALLALPAGALALRFESFGNAPLAKQPGWPEGVLDVINLPSRVYILSGDGPHLYFFQGDVRALNEAIGKYAAVKAPQRRLVLLPGRGKTHSFSRKPIDYDWQLDVPAGRYLTVAKSKDAVLTAHINTQGPRGPLDRKKAAAWVRDLDDDSFDTREAATRALEKLGAAAKPLLRETLKGRPSPEVRRRITALLAKLKGFDVGDLEVPAGVQVVTASDLLAEHFADLKDPNPIRCRMAISWLGELAPYSDRVVPALVDVLAKGKHEDVRGSAAWSLGSLGGMARVALPALKRGLGDPNKNVRTLCQSAIGQIEKARDDPGWVEELKRRRAILEDLDAWKKARGK
jgi:hypothetical protein